MIKYVDSGVCLPHVPLVQVLLQQSMEELQLSPSSEQFSSDLQLAQSAPFVYVYKYEYVEN